MNIVIQKELDNYCEMNNIPTVDGETYRSIYGKMMDFNPKLHGIDEIKEVAKGLMGKLESEYGKHLLRVFAIFPLISTKDYICPEHYQLYYNWLQSMKYTAKAYYIQYNFTEYIDLLLLEHEFVKAFDEEYGFIYHNQYLNRLTELIMMIHEHDYNESFAKCLNDDLIDLLVCVGDKYFNKLDLTDKNVLMELYKTIGEDVGFPEYRFDFFKNYDGYGNLVYRDLINNECI